MSGKKGTHNRVSELRHRPFSVFMGHGPRGFGQFATHSSAPCTTVRKPSRLPQIRSSAAPLISRPTHHYQNCLLGSRTPSAVALLTSPQAIALPSHSSRPCDRLFLPRRHYYVPAVPHVKSPRHPPDYLHLSGPGRYTTLCA